MALDQFAFNVAVARLHELTNALAEAQRSDRTADSDLSWAVWQGVRTLALLVAPMMPHLAEEMIELLGRGEWPGGVGDFAWPVAEERFLRASTMTIAVQVKGKLRGTIEAPVDASAEDVIQAAETDENVARSLAGLRILKRIYVPGRVVNFVVGEQG